MGKKRRGSIPPNREDELAEIEAEFGEDAFEEGRLEPKVRKAQEKVLGALTLRLAKLTPSDLARLGLDSELHEAITLLQKAGQDPSRRRLVKRSRKILRDCDVDAIEQALAGRGPAEERTAQLERDRKNLIAGDDSVLHDYVQAHPGMDRKRLRQLIRQARGDSPQAAKAFKNLYVLLKEGM